MNTLKGLTEHVVRPNTPWRFRPEGDPQGCKRQARFDLLSQGKHLVLHPECSVHIFAIKSPHHLLSHSGGED